MDSSALGAVVSSISSIIENTNSEIIDTKLNGGHEYRGPISMDDDGYYKWNDGTSYNGDFKEGEMTGFVYNFKNGTYSGHVYCGVRHGYGTLILHSTKTKYVGEWNNGKRHGKGVLYYNAINGNTNEKYDGDWINGKREGNGICIYKNGDTYEGEWYNDCRNGKGIMQWKSFNEIYFGEWKNDKPDGRNGIHLICNTNINVNMITMQQLAGKNNFSCFNNLNWYYGEWKNGKRDGFGIYNYSNGSQYKGEWVLNKKHGKGEYIYENGTKFVGEFENDQQKYESKEQNESIQQQICQHFVINDLQLQLNDFNMTKNVILRNWNSIQNILFPNLCILNKLWMLMKLMTVNENKQMQMYQINKNIALILNTYSIYEDNKCDITDPNHCFLFRQFLKILIKISMFAEQNLQEFVMKVIEITHKIKNISSLEQLFWNELPLKYRQLWNNKDSKLLFEERYGDVTNRISLIEDINDNVYAKYIDGETLNKILKNSLIEALIQSVMIKEFEHCYYSKQTDENELILKEYDVFMDLNSMRFLIEECRLFFVILICIKICYDEMINEKEERMRNEIAIEEQEKHDIQQPHIEDNVEQHLKLINILPIHVENMFNQI